MFLFNALYIYVLHQLPKSFTLGELTIIAQGYVLFWYNFIIRIPVYLTDQKPIEESAKMSAIMQVIQKLIQIVYKI